MATDRKVIWDQLFDAAWRNSDRSSRGLVPFWLYPVENGAWIERHVSLFPFSRDSIRYEELRRSLAAYRMVFGQPRQDELLAYLLDRIDPASIVEVVATLRIDLSAATSLNVLSAVERAGDALLRN